MSSEKCSVFKQCEVSTLLRWDMTKVRLQLNLKEEEPAVSMDSAANEHVKFYKRHKKEQCREHEWITCNYY